MSKEKKRKKSDTTLEDITMGKAPPLQPKKIDGKWRYPLQVEIPDKHMNCPKCGSYDIEITDKRAPPPHNDKFFLYCPGCKIEFVQVKKAKSGWCDKHKRMIVGKDCLGCHVFRQNIKQWIEDYGPDAICPHFKKEIPGMEDFHST